MFRHLRLFFLSNRTKSSPKVSKKVDSRIIYFHHLFLKVLLWTREMHFLQPCFEVFAISCIFPFKHPTLSNNYTNLQKKTFKRSPGHLGCRFDKPGKSFTSKVRFVLLKDQIVWTIVLPSTNCPIIVPLETYSVVLANLPYFFAKIWILSLRDQKSRAKCNNGFFQKNDLKLFLWRRKKKFRKPCIFFARRPCFSAQSPKMIKKNRCLTKCQSIFVRCTDNLLFWHTC